MTLNEAFNEVIEALQQKLCEDAISREQAKSDYADWYGYGYEDNTYYKHLCNMPSVTPQPKMGHWVKTPKAVMGEGYMWYCDKCEHQVYQDSSKDYPSEKFCPNCGAKMESNKNTGE